MSDEKLHPIEASPLHARRERVFLILAGFFLGSMTMLNILGTSRFIEIPFTLFDTEITFKLAVGVLPYPLTFLCTDFISELYGRKRANFVVWVGLMLNLWVLLILWLGGILPPEVDLSPETGLPPTDQYDFAFYRIRVLTLSSVFASMIAYLAAQFCDVYLFHFWKKLTNGRHLWLRNNGSTLISQFVDSFAIITIIHFFANGIPVEVDAPIWPQLWNFIGSIYVFKLVIALLDTIPFYIGTHYLSKYLQIDTSRAEE